MFMKILIFFAYLLFAVCVLYGEIGLNRYGAKQGALNRIDVDEKVDIDAMLKSDLIRQRLHQDSLRIAKINDNSDTKNTKNKAAIDAGRIDAKLYDESVVNVNDGKISKIQQEQEDYINSLTEPIKKTYEEKRKLIGDESSIASISFAMPCAALFLAIFTAWLVPPGLPLRKNYGLLGSYIAQGASSLITFDAVMIQQGVEYKAAAISIGAFIAIPLGHYLAGLLWRQIQFEWANFRNKKNGVNIAPPPTMPGIVATRTTTTIEEHKITIDMLPEKFDATIDMIVKEKRFGNGIGLQSLAAQKFGKSEAWISQCVKRKMKMLN